MSSPGKIIVISAPSGAGKTSLVRELFSQVDQFQVAVSHTTRPKRAGEADGRNYYFTDDGTFRSMIDAGAFIEYAEVFGNLYGTSRAEVERIINSGHSTLLEIDWQGAAQIRDSVTDCETIFILPPSLTALRQRLNNRAQDDAATIERRMSAAIDEISHYPEFDYIVVNDDFDIALDCLREIIAGRGDAYRQARQRIILSPMLDALMKH